MNTATTTLADAIAEGFEAIEAHGLHVTPAAGIRGPSAQNGHRSIGVVFVGDDVQLTTYDMSASSRAHRDFGPDQGPELLAALTDWLGCTC
jgi:hypothetical protein